MSFHNVFFDYFDIFIKKFVSIVSYNNTKCVDIIIETRFDYCLVSHLFNIFIYNCTTLEIDVQSFYENVVRDTTREHIVFVVAQIYYFVKNVDYIETIYSTIDSKIISNSSRFSRTTFFSSIFYFFSIFDCVFSLSSNFFLLRSISIFSHFSFFYSTFLLCFQECKFAFKKREQFIVSNFKTLLSLNERLFRKIFQKQKKYENDYNIVHARLFRFFFKYFFCFFDDTRQKKEIQRLIIQTILLNDFRVTLRKDLQILNELTLNFKTNHFIKIELSIFDFA